MWARNKYHNQKVKIGTEKFDSKRESRRHSDLLLLQRAGKISGLERQPKFKLLDKISWKGKTLRTIHYIADFKYIDEDGKAVVEDSKGFQTALYKLKRHMFLCLYPEYKFIET